jgi:glutamate transport system substrate-binding protein
MRSSKTMRLLAASAAVALFASACGGDDDDAAGEETATEAPATDTATSAAPTGDETSAPAATGGETAAGGEVELNEAAQALQDAGTVRVGTKFDQPLFGVNTPTGVQGFDAEIARLIVDSIFQDGDPDSHIEFKEAVSANREPFLEQDQVDMVAATYTINDERDEVVDFAGPYYVAGQDIMVPAGNPAGITGIDDLNTPDLTTCSVEGSTSIQNFDEMAPDGETITFDTYSKCAEAMSDGRADAVTTDNVILIGLIDESPDDFELVDNPFTEEPYGIGVPEGSELRCYVNDVLMQAYDSGAWAQAYESTVGTAGSATPEPPDVNDEGC